ncbi:hypothetical protein RHMOL_Rhmol03G0093200 [Rhododendron molle]|uniref:Uncharacterized protein n=1 Tax=Rhododendron molle TaxID=49168 RepID=A0ACC0PDD0_RHOML|nr:hypothetical protein RHMOL_Rhmol03G0093200 [Rhododendron molle]
MATKGFVLYLLSGFSVAVLSVLFINNHPINQNTFSPHLSSLNYTFSHHPYGSETTTWPELEFSWRIVLATVIGFLGSAFGTVGGVGGGGIFVPMLTLIVGFDTKSAAALSKCMIMGASAASVWYNLRVPHPCREVPILDYDLALLFQPMLMLGITIGVALSVVFPYWLITVLIIILFMGTSSRSFFKATQMWKEETILKKEMARQQETFVKSHGESNFTFQPEMEKDAGATTRMGCVSTSSDHQGMYILKRFVEVKISVPFVLVFQFPAALGVFGNECVKLYKESKRRRISGNTESVCEATLEWTPIQLAFCALCGILGGTVGGLLGSGGGFILGPLLLEIGVIPQVASATATFVMMFSSSLSVVEFYLLKRFPIPYAIYLIAVSILAGFWGQFFIRKLIACVRRASIIVFILSGVIFASALTMDVNVWVVYLRRGNELKISGKKRQELFEDVQSWTVLSRAILGALLGAKDKNRLLFRDVNSRQNSVVSVGPRSTLEGASDLFARILRFSCFSIQNDDTKEAVKKRRRTTKKPYSRSIVGATLEVIQKKRTEKPEVRDAAREAALREIKERIKKTKDEKKAKKAEGRQRLKKPEARVTCLRAVQRRVLN